MTCIIPIENKGKVMKKLTIILAIVGIVMSSVPVFWQVIIREMTPLEQYDEEQRQQEQRLGKTGRELNMLQDFMLNFIFQESGIGPLSPKPWPHENPKYNKEFKQNSHKKQNQTAKNKNNQKMREVEDNIRQQIQENHGQVYQYVQVMLREHDIDRLDKYAAMTEDKNNAPIVLVYGADVFLAALSEVDIESGSDWQKYLTQIKNRIYNVHFERIERILDKDAYNKVLMQAMSALPDGKIGRQPPGF